MKLKFNIINICLYLYLLLKPFYIGESGTLQISDVFILIAFILILLTNKKDKDELIEKMLNDYKIFILFISFVFVINLIGYLRYSTTDFLVTILHYTFIAIGIYVFIYKVGDKKFLKNIYYISMFNIIMQVIIFLAGIGRYYATTRYMGTFNDPNQFGFFIILMIMYIYIIKNILNRKDKLFILAFLLGSYLIVESASTGMILALVSFLAVQFICNLNNIIINVKKYISKIIIFFIIILLLTAIFFIMYNLDNEFKSKINNFFYNNVIDTFMYKRILGKFDKVEDSTMSILKDRHLEQIVNYPEYLIFGAGQGYSVRFTGGRYAGEIHSTLPSILFYYGIIPFMILMVWIYRNLKGLTLKQYSIYIAILIESFTLINQRQLLLWVLILMANLCQKNNKKEESIKNEEII